MRTPTRRPGFTLVEVLVAAALCILIMTILTYAFQQAMDTFSLLKSTGELQERLRAAEVVMRRDLQNVGLDMADGSPPRVSNVRLDQGGASPAAGFLRIEWNGNGTNEGNDPDGIPSGRSGMFQTA